ncbi:MAG: N-acetylneuraminate synthase family protein [Rhizobiaceae bacterium]
MAEVGTTCLGDLNKALALVAAAKSAGMDAVKFQLVDANQDTREHATYKLVVDGRETTANMRQMFSALAFEKSEWKQIAEACRDADIEFLATCDYCDGIDVLEEIGIAAHKIGAWDTTYRHLIKHIGKTGKPMIVDLGPTTQDELDELCAWHLDAGGSVVVPLHDYHTDVAGEMNMRAISHLLATMPGPVGYSSPNQDSDMDFLAVALGAHIIEKRLILDRRETAFHAHESMEPDELMDWARRIRSAEAALGQQAIIPSQRDLAGAAQYYRSVATLRDIAKGEVLSAEIIDGKRPGTGIPTKRIDEMLGRRASRDIPANTLLETSDLE